VHRLVNEPELLALELEALTVAAKAGLDNISLLMPMVRSLAEIEQLRTLLMQSELASVMPIRLWAKCDTPALAIQADQLPSLGLAGVCIDVVGLSQLITGIDSLNMQMAHHLRQNDPAVLQAVDYVVTCCRNGALPTVLTADMDVLDAEVVHRAVKAGIAGVAVPPGQAEGMRRLLATIEQQLLLDQLLAEG